MLPANWNWLKFCSGKPDDLPKATTPSLITWKYINSNIPWSLIFLLGGGFALARGGKESGMSAMLGTYLSGLSDLPFLLLLFVICLFAQVFTEFASNVAVANGKDARCFWPNFQWIPRSFNSLMIWSENCSYVARPRGNGTSNGSASTLPYVPCRSFMLHGFPYTSRNTAKCHCCGCCKHRNQRYSHGWNRVVVDFIAHHLAGFSNLGSHRLSKGNRSRKTRWQYSLRNSFVMFFLPQLTTFPDWAAAMVNATKLAKAAAPVVAAAIPASGSLGLLVNATNAIVNGTVH